ncbi:glycosyltransferase family 2 protein [Sphingobacterium multivorum]|uniref:PGL/p-HBAD biosynthesis glycosyltransferase Rv2957/MT3031 n=1 Tax=Sphingobacterium multivorum TaxID=28454 RepID=A0A2X2J2X9_SPHMU|nr:glycosyltransferase family 2 protein [Sphingobacterium multivorum]QRQ61302.1 glycosyltransferase [Sphingobacterium multivorum]SPZ88652.1 PGL/p-HBAD biosynthesis glycosyltransferase Rv2957/MT3031 [Sphingobacterium multivorum]HAK28278.1 glycosyltransferase [Sphingobacterium sp.]
MKPKISIITINYNNKIGLLETIKSVIEQSYDNYEFIIIDGNSNDGSKDIIAEHKTYLTYSASEPDNGIYHAMNKGTRISQGDFLLFLNSGDSLFCKDTLQDVSTYLSSSSDIFYGNLKYISDDNEWVRDYTNDIIDFEYLMRDTLPHPASFIKSTLLKNRQFPYDENLKIVSDWKFFINSIIKENARIKHIPFVTANFIENGVSSKPENRNLITLERLNVLIQDFTDLFATSFDKLLSIEREYSNIMRSRPIKAFLKIRRKFEK